MASLVTMADIARLADVTRQAVTNWRSRPAAVPFPSPATVAGGVEQFDRDAVLDWLEQTGRGRNDEARLDAPAISIPDGLDLDGAVVLLALRAAVAQDIGPLSAFERVQLAQEVDTNDRYLLAEVREAASDDELAVYVDGLLASTYGPSDALARLYGTRAAQGTRGLTFELIMLLQQIAEACRTHLGPDDVSIELRLEPRARQVAAGFAAADPECDRATLRHLALDEVPIGPGTSPRVRVVSAVGLGDAEALALADRVALGLGDADVAIVLGPASALCDRLNPLGELYGVRKGALEMGGADYGCALAAAFKLPRGLWRAAHRQSLGLWVLQGDTASTGVVVADLSGCGIDATELAADVMGALQRTGARSYRYGRVVPYTDIWTRDTVVVPGIGAVLLPNARGRASVHDRLVEATLVTREAIEGFDVPVASRSETATTTPRSLGELIDDKAIALQSGSRISDEHADPHGSLRIISADPDVPGRRIDPLVAADHYSHSARTEPGDVIFTVSPTPQALVDETGGSLVAYPSRILRFDPLRAGIGPRTLAAAINEMAVGSEWQTWFIPSVPRSQIQQLEDALGGVLDHLALLRRHEEAATDLTANLIQGVAEGSVALGPPSTEKKAS